MLAQISAKSERTISAKKKVIHTVLFVAFAMGQPRDAKAVPRGNDMPPCALQIAKRYQVPVGLLRAIRHREGGIVGKQSLPNSNGTVDIGPMQINSSWLSKLADNGVSREILSNDYCTNVVVAAWVLRNNYVATSDWSEAVAAYNAGIRSRNTPRAKGYARDVMMLWKKHYKTDFATTTPKIIVFEP